MANARRQPRYIDPAGDSGSGALPVSPPFLFSGATARVFPLRANMAQLTHFVDHYVNMDIPPGIVQFRPALPYVYLMVLDYGSMSAASVSAQNVGWVSQHEVAFTVPLLTSGTSMVRISMGSHLCPSISLMSTRGWPTWSS